LENYVAVRAIVFGFHADVFLFETKVRISLSLFHTSAQTHPHPYMITLAGMLITSSLYQVYTLVLLDLPGLLFFSTYTLLVLFWAEIYYQANAVSLN
jgi:Protein of unknown function (DUF1084)